jgi:hypothetical protein
VPGAEVRRRTAGEGKSHRTRGHVCEESHCGLVPRNHSNQDQTPSAESEEGRLRIEDTFPLDTYPTPSGIARVPQVGECATGQYAGPLFIRDKNRMRSQGTPAHSEAVFMQPWVRSGQVHSLVVWLAA